MGRREVGGKRSLPIRAVKMGRMRVGSKGGMRVRMVMARRR